MTDSRTDRRTTDELVALVRKHAEVPANYEAGWDTIVEATEDEELATLIGKATTLRGAIWKVGNYVHVRHSVAEDIRAA